MFTYSSNQFRNYTRLNNTEAHSTGAASDHSGGVRPRRGGIPATRPAQDHRVRNGGRSDVASSGTETMQQNRKKAGKKEKAIADDSKGTRFRNLGGGIRRTLRFLATPFRNAIENMEEEERQRKIRQEEHERAVRILAGMSDGEVNKLGLGREAMERADRRQRQRPEGYHGTAASTRIPGYSPAGGLK